MDFTLGETQHAVIEAAAGVLGRGRGAGEPDGDYDRGLWKELGQAGLLGLAVPEYMDGGGLGVLDTAVLLTEIGRQAAPVPALATLMMGVLPVTRWAGRGLQQHLLTRVSAGDVVLTAAIREPSAPMPPQPATTLSVHDGTGAGPGLRQPPGQRAAQLAGRGGRHGGRRRRLGHQGLLRRADAAARPASRGSRGAARRPGWGETAELCRWLDIQSKRNTVLTFGGGVDEIQRELIATAGLGLPRVPR